MISHFDQATLHGRQPPSRPNPKGIFGDIAAVVSKNVLVLLAVPLIAGALATGYAVTRTKEYTSYSYLRVNENTARSADAIMSSVPVLDRVLAKFTIAGTTADQRRRELDSSRSISVAPNETPRTSGLFRLSVTQPDPALAQAINAAFIEAWLEATLPPPIKLQSIKDEIAQTERMIPEMSSLLDTIRKASPPVLTAENKISDDPTTPALALITKIDQANQRITKLKEQMLGASQDAVFSPPNLPDAPNPSRAARFGLFAAVGGETLLLAFLLFRRWRSSDCSAYGNNLSAKRISRIGLGNTVGVIQASVALAGHLLRRGSGFDLKSPMQTLEGNSPTALGPIRIIARNLVFAAGTFAMIIGLYFGVVWLLQEVLPRRLIYTKQADNLMSALRDYRTAAGDYPTFAKLDGTPIYDNPISSLKDVLEKSGHGYKRANLEDPGVRYVSVTGQSYGLLFHSGPPFQSIDKNLCKIEVDVTSTDWWGKDILKCKIK